MPYLDTGISQVGYLLSNGEHLRGNLETRALLFTTNGSICLRMSSAIGRAIDCRHSLGM